MLHDDVTKPILDAFCDVDHALGHGFLESVYQKAMVVALSARGLRAGKEVPVSVRYCGELVGEFYCDLLVEQRVVVELKACRALEAAHEAQLLNYLRASSIEVGLLLHFAPKPAFKRLLMTNDRKTSPSRN